MVLKINKTKQRRAWGLAQIVEYLPSKDLTSTLVSPKKGKEKKKGREAKERKS
jgi:hypothetical protein